MNQFDHEVKKKKQQIKKSNTNDIKITYNTNCALYLTPTFIRLYLKVSIECIARCWLNRISRFPVFYSFYSVLTTQNSNFNQLEWEQSIYVWEQRSTPFPIWNKIEHIIYGTVFRFSQDSLAKRHTNTSILKISSNNSYRKKFP